MHYIYSLSALVASAGCFLLLPFPLQQTSCECHEGLQKHAESGLQPPLCGTPQERWQRVYECVVAAGFQHLNEEFKSFRSYASLPGLCWQKVPPVMGAAKNICPYVYQSGQCSGGRMARAS